MKTKRQLWGRNLWKPTASYGSGIYENQTPSMEVEFMKTENQVWEWNLWKPTASYQSGI
jgi:hypothetical protein